MLTGAIGNFLCEVLSRDDAQLPLPSQPPPAPLKFTCAWAIEINKKCQDELLFDKENGPAHLFNSIEDFLPPNARAWCGLDGNKRIPNAKLRQRLPGIKMLRRAWCLRCKADCQLIPTHVHQASAPCIYHSSLGGHAGDEGSGMYLHWAWIALIRTLRIAVLLTENVASFGDGDFCEFLADIYIVIRILTCPTNLAFPARRERQLVLLILKTFIYPALHDAGVQCHDDDGVVAMMNMQETINIVFNRQRAAAFSWRDFLLPISSNPELVSEKIWAGNRRAVLERNADDPIRYTDPPGSVLAVLSLKERSRWDEYQRLWPSEAADVGQTPSATPQHTCGPLLHCLSKHVSLIVVPGRVRPARSAGPSGISSSSSSASHGADTDDSSVSQWITPGELWALMGFPITPSQVEAAGGATCAFSQSRTANGSRTPHSQRCQIGNTIHTTALSTLELILVIMFPTLGEKLPRRSYTQQLPQATTGSSAAGSAGHSLARLRTLKRNRS
jgi:site-specific DNA-cytosine methylase